jgi:hypothetical protein
VPVSTVHKILRNRIYSGDFDWKGKTYHAITFLLSQRICGIGCRRSWIAVFQNIIERPDTSLLFQV